MVLYKIVIGIAFNRRSFKISGVAGSIADEIIEMTRQSSVKSGFPDFDQYWSNNDNANFAGTLRDSKTGNLLELQTGQVVFTHNSKSRESALNFDDTYQEFLKFYRVVSKFLGSPSIRRIGVVGEFYFSTGSEENCSVYLSDKLVKFGGSKTHSNRFHLSFDEQEPVGNLTKISVESSPFWNYIYNVYPSELDASSASEGGFRATLDVQRYFNPAPSDVSKVAREVIDKFKDKKKGLKREFVSLGLINV